jgi:uncharacterized iron-regulated membrane protein
MSVRVQQWMSRVFLLIGIGCLVLGGWLWWIDRPPVSVLRIDGPVEVGAVAAAAEHAVEIPVTNTGSEAIRLVGLDNDFC